MGVLTDKWSRAQLEIEYYDSQLESLTSTALFKRLTDGKAAKIREPKTELFREESRELFYSVLGKETFTPKELKNNIKGKVFSLLQSNIKEIKKIVDDYILLEGKDRYKLSIVSHRTQPESEKKASNLRDTIKTISFLIGSEYSVISIKNNQILFLDGDSYYSLKITKGKS
jgi:hypothetical protein